MDDGGKRKMMRDGWQCSRTGWTINLERGEKRSHPDSLRVTGQGRMMEEGGV